MKQLIIISVIFLGGIILASSDNPWFPWANFVGVLMVGMVALWAKEIK